MESIASDVSISVFAATDVGMKRRRNEDSFLVADLASGNCGLGSDIIRRRIGEEGALLVLADGMGGAAAGDVASEMAVLSVCRALKEMPFGLSIDEQLIEATERANHEIWERSHVDGMLAGMGTTLTTVLVQAHWAHISQVGDSRAYLLRGDKIYQLTKDQSLAQMLLDNGVINEEQAAHYPKNMIMQALGVEPFVEPAITETAIERGDYLILCSDGLSNKVTNEEMRHAIQTSLNLMVACRLLVEIANERGGEDNITVIIARFDDSDERI